MYLCMEVSFVSSAVLLLVGKFDVTPSIYKVLSKSSSSYNFKINV